MGTTGAISCSIALELLGRVALAGTGGRDTTPSLSKYDLMNERHRKAEKPCEWLPPPVPADRR